MFKKLEAAEIRNQELSTLLSDPKVANNPKEFAKLAKEQSSLQELVDVFNEYRQLEAGVTDAQEILADGSDKELCELAEIELAENQAGMETLLEKIKVLLIPKDPMDDRNVLMEIRAGTGGDEAGLFAGDLYRMYLRYIESKNWKIDMMSSNPQGIGGFKEIIFGVKGQGAYGMLKYESGVHRVQRVPQTETSGRIHTSAASVAVLPEPEAVDVDIHANELKIDVYRSSGPGGQSVNTTDSAVRITHVPTGMVVTCQDEKSQHKNKAKALTVLRARLYEKKMAEKNAEISDARRSMVSTGDRSAKIRTFNFPQNRVTDHRISLTLYKLNTILEGDLDELNEHLKMAERAEKLKSDD